MDMTTQITNDILSKVCNSVDGQTLIKLQVAISQTLNDYTFDPKPTTLTVYGQEHWKQILDYYCNVKMINNVKPSTIKTYSYYINRLFDYFPSKTIIQITTSDLIEFMDHMRRSSKTGVSQTTLSTVRLVFNSFFGWCKQKQIIPNNPAEGIDQIKVDTKVIVTFDDEELERIRMNCESERDFAMVELLCSTGLRIGGAISLNIEDIDWSTGAIRVTEKGNKERVVVLNGRAMARLKAYIMTHPENMRDHGPLFISQRYPYNRLKETGFRDALEQIGERAGIEKSCSTHQYRRKFATDALRRGCPINDLAEMMGHSSYNTTRRYVNISQDKKIQNFKTYAI